MLKAIKENNTAEVKKLIQNGTDIPKMALINAVHHGNLEIVNLLLESNIDIHNNNDIVLVIAACSGHLEVFDKMILSTCIHGDDQVQEYVNDEVHLNIIYRFIDNDYDIDGNYSEFKRDIYPKKINQSTDHIEIVKKLIEYGCNVNTMVDMPLRAAAHVGNTEIVNLLMTSGAKVEKLMKYRRLD